AVDLDVVAATADSDGLLAATEEHGPDVVLLGLAVAEADRARLIRAIRTRHPSAAVVLLCESATAAEVLDAIEAGAAGYLLKDLDPAELAQAIRAAAAGDTPLSPRAS